MGQEPGVKMDSSESGVNSGPRRRKRIITHARKEQNRIAQQLYRELASPWLGNAYLTNLHRAEAKRRGSEAGQPPLP